MHGSAGSWVLNRVVSAELGLQPEQWPDRDALAGVVAASVQAVAYAKELRQAAVAARLRALLVHTAVRLRRRRHVQESGAAAPGWVRDCGGVGRRARR
jgi:hypothetical protein